MDNEVLISDTYYVFLVTLCFKCTMLLRPLDQYMALCVLVAFPGFFPSHSHLPDHIIVVVTWGLSFCSLFWSLDFHFRLREGLREPNVPEMPRKWELWMNSWAYWSTGSLCILTFIISVGCWCSWLMGPGAVHPSLHINYWRGVFPVIYLTVGCDKYP